MCFRWSPKYRTKACDSFLPSNYIKVGKVDVQTTWIIKAAPKQQLRLALVLLEHERLLLVQPPVELVA